MELTGDPDKSKFGGLVGTQDLPDWFRSNWEERNCMQEVQTTLDKCTQEGE